MSCPRVLLPVILFSVSASAQSVVSARSGVIHYSEGAVFVDNQRVEQKLGKFTDIKPGSELSTEYGHAEILLTPGMFLRIGDKSAIRMVSNRLSDTRLELLRGSAIVESVTAAPGTSVVIICKNSETRFHRPGLYRFNSEPAELRVQQGEAEVLAQSEPKIVTQGQALSLASPTATPQSIADAGDGLDRWSMRRSISVAANDAAAAQAEDMAVFLDTPMDPFGLGTSYGTVPSVAAMGPYPSAEYETYVGTGLWRSPFFLPRIRIYSPVYPGYGAYRSGYRPISPAQTVIPGPFRPPARMYAPPNRPAMISPAAPRSTGRVGGGHR